MYTFIALTTSLAHALPDRSRAEELRELYLHGEVEDIWNEATPRWQQNQCPRGPEQCDLFWRDDLRGGTPRGQGQWTCPVTSGGTHYRGYCTWVQEVDYPDGSRLKLNTWLGPGGKLDEVSWETVLEPGGVEPPSMLPGWYVPGWMCGSASAVLVLLGLVGLSRQPR